MPAVRSNMCFCTAASATRAMRLPESVCAAATVMSVLCSMLLGVATRPGHLCNEVMLACRPGDGAYPGVYSLTDIGREKVLS